MSRKNLSRILRMTPMASLFNLKSTINLRNYCKIGKLRSGFLYKLKTDSGSKLIISNKKIKRLPKLILRWFISTKKKQLLSKSKTKSSEKPIKSPHLQRLHSKHISTPLSAHLTQTSQPKNLKLAKKNIISHQFNKIKKS